MKRPTRAILLPIVAAIAAPAVADAIDSRPVLPLPAVDADYHDGGAPAAAGVNGIAVEHCYHAAVVVSALQVCAYRYITHLRSDRARAVEGHVHVRVHCHVAVHVCHGIVDSD